MSYLSFDKSKLINLEYSLYKEILRTNRSGAYSSSSIIGCNTRKYHGLFVCPIENFGDEHHVLLSSLDVTVVQHEKEFNLGIHKYNGNNFDPKGHKYIEALDFEVIPKTSYRVGGVLLTVEFVFVKNKEQILLKYTLEEATSDTYLKFKPFLAFRSVRSLCIQNMNVNYKYVPTANGIKMNLYSGFPDLYMQFSKEAEYVPVPDWYVGLEYLKEQERGNPYSEDLFVPGFFEVPIKKGESIIFSASTSEADPQTFLPLFNSEANDRIHRDSLYNNLRNSFQQFLVERHGRKQLFAGYHWYGPRLRDTFLTLPTVFSALNDKTAYLEILDSAVQTVQEEYLSLKSLPDKGKFKTAAAPLCLFYTLQECRKHCSNPEVWKKYYPFLIELLNLYKDSPASNVYMHENGLIYAKEEGKALTWMDAVVNGKPVTPRGGFAVEVNAWWYNAICFAVELAKELGDHSVINEWSPISERVKVSYKQVFWNEDKMSLYDYVDGDFKDSSIRPNMIFAASLGYSPLQRDQQMAILKVIEDELLTPKGLRTLSPQDPKYIGVVEDNPHGREYAAHQGTVWPWLAAFFAEAYLAVYKANGVRFIERMLANFEEEMRDHCISSIAEMYNGNPPHKPKGAISLALNVSGALKIIDLIEKNKK